MKTKHTDYNSLTKNTVHLPYLSHASSTTVLTFTFFHRENAISKVDMSDLGPSSSAAAVIGEGVGSPERAEEEVKQEGADASNNVNGAQASRDPLNLGKQ